MKAMPPRFLVSCSHPATVTFWPAISLVKLAFSVLSCKSTLIRTPIGQSPRHIKVSPWNHILTILFKGNWAFLSSMRRHGAPLLEGGHEPSRIVPLPEPVFTNPLSRCRYRTGKLTLGEYCWLGLWAPLRCALRECSAVESILIDLLLIHSSLPQLCTNHNCRRMKYHHRFGLDFPPSNPMSCWLVQ